MRDSFVCFYEISFCFVFLFVVLFEKLYYIHHSDVPDLRPNCLVTECFLNESKCDVRQVVLLFAGSIKGRKVWPCGFVRHHFLSVVRSVSLGLNHLDLEESIGSLE